MAFCAPPMCPISMCSLAKPLFAWPKPPRETQDHHSMSGRLKLNIVARFPQGSAVIAGFSDAAEDRNQPDQVPDAAGRRHRPSPRPARCCANGSFRKARSAEKIAVFSTSGRGSKPECLQVHEFGALSPLPEAFRRSNSWFASNLAGWASDACRRRWHRPACIRTRLRALSHRACDSGRDFPVAGRR